MKFHVHYKIYVGFNIYQVPTKWKKSTIVLLSNTRMATRHMDSSSKVSKIQPLQYDAIVYSYA